MQNWLQRAARVRPQHPALELAGAVRGEVSYSQVYEHALSRAALMQSGGVSAGDRVALPGGDPLVFAHDLHAALLSGAVAMPLDPRLTDEEQEYRLGVAFDPPPGAATLMFTSGTTSLPKPVYLTDANWEANAVGSALALGLDQDERWLCTMPLAHVGGLSILLRSTLYATTVVLHDGFQTEAVLSDLMDPERAITLVSLVPTMLTRLLDAGLQRPPSLRWVLLGGGPIAPALLDRARAAGVPVAWTYGMTETCSQFATFGRVLHGAELRFEGGLTGHEGEIVVRGRNVAPLSLDPDGWLRTGDLGSLDEEGRLVVEGRKADTIISGGENVSPSEVEAVLVEHEAVIEAGVYGIVDAEWGEAVAAKVVLADGQAATAEELALFLRTRLAAFKVPKTIAFIETLPRTTSGKLLRRDLSATPEASHQDA